MGKEDKPVVKEAPVGKNHQLKVVSYDRGTKTALVELSPAYVDASRGGNETRRYALMSHVPKSTLAYLIGAKKGDKMDVGAGAVHAYRPDRMAEYVRALDKHKAERETARPAADRNADAVAQLEAMVEDSDDSSAGEVDTEELLRELGEAEGKK